MASPGREGIEEVIICRVVALAPRCSRSTPADLRHEDHASSPAVPRVASRRALRSAFCSKWSDQAGIDWYALRTASALGHE